MQSPRGRPVELDEREDQRYYGPNIALEETLAELARNVQKRQRLNESIDAGVDAARSAGASWSAIARSLGVSPQAVQQRFRRPAP